MPRRAARTLVLRPADPFDLIRWLARSQSDPRKAVAELVQNSIDAHARHVTIERRRLRGGPALVVRDDGEGVLPSLAREEALRFIATNIGRSRVAGMRVSMGARDRMRRPRSGYLEIPSTRCQRRVPVQQCSGDGHFEVPRDAHRPASTVTAVAQRPRRGWDMSAPNRGRARATRENSMPESVYKVVELVGSSTESWEKAASAAVERASKSLREVRIAEVVQLDMQIDGGKVKAYRTKLKLSFKYQDK